LTTRQYGRLIDEWVVMIRLNPGNYGTRSVRGTKVALIYKKTNNLRACARASSRSGTASWKAPYATYALIPRAQLA
jgi:4-hydroxy-3-methylbut-2-en-1-yl diphosphate synthase IspG/GcpE